MNTTLQIRIDSKTKQAAQKVFKSRGLDMTAGLRFYLTQVAQTKTVPFHPLSAEHFTPAKKRQLIAEVEEALKHGKRYNTIQEAHSDILG